MNIKIASLILVVSCLFAIIGEPLCAEQSMTANEAKIAAMISDGSFTIDDSTATSEIMKAGSYYALKAKIIYDAASKRKPKIIFAGQTPEQMWFLRMRHQAFNRDKHGNLIATDCKIDSVRVWLWTEPSEDTKSAAKAKAAEILACVRDDILAIKDKYPELAGFTGDNAKISGSYLIFAMNQQGISSAVINIYLGEPQIGYLTAQTRVSILFPKQKMELHTTVLAQDEELTQRIKDIISRRVDPLVQDEVAMGSYPAHINGTL